MSISPSSPTLEWWRQSSDLFGEFEPWMLIPSDSDGEVPGQDLQVTSRAEPNALGSAPGQDSFVPVDLESRVGQAFVRVVTGEGATQVGGTSSQHTIAEKTCREAEALMEAVAGRRLSEESPTWRPAEPPAWCPQTRVPGLGISG